MANLNDHIAAMAPETRARVQKWVDQIRAIHRVHCPTCGPDFLFPLEAIFPAGPDHCVAFCPHCGLTYPAPPEFE